jgi:Sec-independent protein translocase protein TatA
MDMDWGKLVLIGVVALLVVAPKELPRVMHALRQWIDNVRS